MGRDSPVFCTLRGHPIEPAYIRALLPRLARKVGTGNRVHPRALRNAHAAQLAARRVPVELLQVRLGHGSRVTTDFSSGSLRTRMSCGRRCEPYGWA
ncbi:MAG: hypothetical protein E6J69_16715 [Deltaproteobacteria bacterium]|nr:MAG: hypothetical protein E6J69_16715 [Deltaproteobacteria bacterium]